MSIATTIRGLIVDLRAEGLEYLIDETFPVPVRHRTALTTALGACVLAEEETWTPLGDLRRLRRLRALRKRVHAALHEVEAWGRTTRWASWFKKGL